jgi:hypothetical protein
LEYANIILYRFVSDYRAEFADIAEGVSKADLAVETLDYRRAKDKSDKSLEVYKFFVNALYVALTRASDDGARDTDGEEFIAAQRAVTGCPSLHHYWHILSRRRDLASRGHKLRPPCARDDRLSLIGEPVVLRQCGRSGRWPCAGSSDVDGSMPMPCVPRLPPARIEANERARRGCSSGNACARQITVREGTVFAGSKLPLTVRFFAKREACTAGWCRRIVWQPDNTKRCWDLRPVYSRRREPRCAQGGDKPVDVSPKVRVGSNRYRVPIAQRAKRLRQVLGFRHFRILDQDWNHADSRVKREFNFPPHKIRGIIQPSATLLVGNADPFQTDDREKHIRSLQSAPDCHLVILSRLLTFYIKE